MPFLRQSVVKEKLLRWFVCLMMTSVFYSANSNAVVINEILVSHSGSDNNEFVELKGMPGNSLEGLSIISVEGDVNSSVGRIDRRIDLKPFHQIGSNGYFLVGVCSGLNNNYSTVPDKSISSNTFENSSTTFALVQTQSLQGNRVNGSEIVVDTIALTDGGSEDQFFFNAPVIGPDGRFFPAGANRINDGVDTNTEADWKISSFNLNANNTPLSGGFDGCAPIPASIPMIQGESSRSSYTGEVISTSGIVTQYTSNGRHYWLQDAIGDANKASSDAIFVSNGGRVINAPAIGDVVTITASVEEQQFGNALSLTRLNNVSSTEIISSTNPLPKAIEITFVPNDSIKNAIQFWEPLEGMRVSLKKAYAVGPSSRFGEFVVLGKSNRKRNKNFDKKSNLLFLQLKQKSAQLNYNPDRIIVLNNGPLSGLNVLPGDKFKYLTGVLDYTFSNYKIVANQYEYHPNFDGEIENQQHGEDERHGEDDELSVASFNLENLFDLVDEPNKSDGSSTPTADQLETKLTKLSLAIEHRLGLPDIVVVQEIENTAILQQLGDRINLLSENTNYTATSFESSDNRGIEVGFLWNANRVSLSSAYQMQGDDIDVAFGSKSASKGREPIVGIFEYNGQSITIVGVHFKSKSGDDPVFGTNQPPLRSSERLRKLQAHAVRNHIDVLLNANPRLQLMVAGDFNDFQFMEPGEGQDHTLAIVAGNESDSKLQLKNLVLSTKKRERYSFIYEGNSQVLDHILVSPALYKSVDDIDFIHINASYPHAMSNDATTALRSSDHDPLSVSFEWE